MKRIVILKRYDREFRIPLYNILGTALKESGIQLDIIYGQPDRIEKQTIKDLISPHQWGTVVKNRYINLGRRSVCWQPVLRYTRNADLVIAQQGSRLLINYLLQIRRFFRKKPLLAFWGHGMNFQARSQKAPLERFKAFYSNHVDCWFAYNTMSKEVLTKRGYPAERIFSLQNTIDSKEEGKIYDSITAGELDSLKKDLQISEKDVVGIYCGSLYAEKRIDFLVEALIRVRSSIPKFHFIIVGDGILKPEVLKWIEGHESWIHYVGAQFGKQKLKFFRIASFQLIPGVVGLNIIDSFVTLTPLITTQNKGHGPEISYLANYENGIMTENTMDNYGEAIVQYVNDVHLQERMIEGCRIARDVYTIENMAANFKKGIDEILKITN